MSHQMTRAMELLIQQLSSEPVQSGRKRPATTHSNIPARLHPKRLIVDSGISSVEGTSSSPNVLVS